MCIRDRIKEVNMSNNDSFVTDLWAAMTDHYNRGPEPVIPEPANRWAEPPLPEAEDPFDICYND
ncbi:MAG: hypothetical protein N2204_00255, partial [Anaerolineae bacterium]|nr:hypothetical protein [Anaerolineae bacterium]